MGSRQLSIDFGATGLRAVEFSKDKKGNLTVYKTAERPLLPGIIHRGRVSEPEGLVAELKRLREEAHFKSVDVLFGVSNNAVVVRRVEVDWQPEKYFRQALPYAIPDGVLAEDTDYQVDYHPLGEFLATLQSGEQVRRAQVLMVAVETAVVDGYIDVLKQAGFRPSGADHLGFALTRLAARSGRAGVEAVIDIGAQATNLVLQMGGQPMFVRHISKGLESVVDEVMNQFGWDLNTAVDAVKVLGVSTAIHLDPAQNAFGGVGQPQADVHPAQPIIDRYATEYINEIRTSVDWFLENSASVKTLNHVVLSGGGAMLPGMADRIAAELHIPVEVIEPFERVGSGKNVDVSPDESMRWATAVGIATGAK